MPQQLTLDKIEGPWMDLAHRVIRRAGYNPTNEQPEITGGQYHAEFEALLIALSYIGARKTDDYGDFRMQDIRSWSRETWGCYWDIMRKFGRLEQQLQTSGPSFNHGRDDSALTPCQVCQHQMQTHLDDLMETLSDQAVYCLRMIQILARLESKGLVV